ncbi:MAG: SacI homology domain-containing protein [Monoraphidium minutum]|nr:MAG: SacI homology domain-containing protein [Monoraphidium minutum]
MAAPPQHEALRLLVSGSLVAVQPAGAAGGKVETLSIDAASGDVRLTQQPALGGGCEPALALIGAFRLRAATVVAVVTGAQKVATLYGQPVFRVTATKLIAPRAAFDAGDQRLLSYLRDAIDPEGTGRGLHFAYQLDLTLSAQRLADALSDPAQASKPPPRRADWAYFWNRTLAKPLMDAGADAFVPAMILGSIGQLTGVEAKAHGRSVELDVTLIARRSADRSGTRHWRRGADTQGSAANLVETEQLVSLDGGRVVASYVQLRGSIPLIWTQIPNIKYKPPTKLLAGEASSVALDAHMDALLAKYKAVSCVNLVNQHGSEGALEAAFAKEAARYAAAKNPALHYTAFDFHKECGATNYGRLSVLWSSIEADAAAYGLYLQPGPAGGPPGVAAARQSGAFRINCVDCLDRTNVVQGVLGRNAIESVLRTLGVLAAGETLAATLPQVEAQFKVLWADHGDDISRQYAGTGALKSGFTRTGKRTLGGLVDDGVKSVVRYYLNNFHDGHKQDALDLISGAYTVKRDVKLRFRRQHSPALPLLGALALLGFAIHSIRLAVAGQLPHQVGAPPGGGPQQEEGAGGGPSPLQVLGARVAAPLLAAAGLLFFVQKNGKHLVDAPQLCPQLANTAAAAAIASAKKQS